MKVANKLSVVVLVGAFIASFNATRALAQKIDFDKPASQQLAESGVVEDASPAQTPTTPAPQKQATDSAEGLGFSVAPYLWFAGMHGTAGVNNHLASVHASFGDIFHNLDMGLMGAAETRYKKFGAPVDFVWMKLSDEKASPFERGPTGTKVKVTETMLAPKVAYRLLDGEMVKVDGTVGIRYLHVGTTLELESTDTFRSFYQSANWVDYVGGGRLVATLSPKVQVTVLGDAGAGGANLDYQLAGILGYKIKPSIILQGAWRYMDVNYRPSSGFVYDMTTSGVLIGATFNLK